MGHFLYWPYDEVTLLPSPDNDGVIVESPWLQAKVKSTAENGEHLKTLLEKFQNKTVSPKDLALVNGFFSHFDKFPLCYILSASPKPKTPDKHQLLDESLKEASVKEIILKAIQRHPSAHLMEADIDPLVTRLGRKEWTWDADAAIAFAGKKNGVHPESFFSVVRRYHLLEIIENDKGNEVFEKIKSLPQEGFVQAAARIVRQNHYVTQKCGEALAPAVQIAQSAKPQVEDFIKAERGHDRLLALTLKSLSQEPESLPVTANTAALMALLTLCAERNFLAFALVVDFFERSSYQSSDPMAQLLEGGGFHEAAKQINRHMEINDAGGHENVACGFLEPMAFCDPEYAVEAIHLAETVSLVMNSVTASTLLD